MREKGQIVEFSFIRNLIAYLTHRALDYIIFLYTFERTGAVYSSAPLFDAFYIRAQFPHDMLELRASSLHVGEKSFACSICVL